ncbi:MAG: 50S ribosomal protein L5, partial [Prevotella sp.]|nr:50S ribosomal protein L5 [Prevotella sp.]
MDTAQLKKFYAESIAPALKEQFNYSSSMQIPVLKKIVINQGLGDATQDKKIID